MKNIPITVLALMSFYFYSCTKHQFVFFDGNEPLNEYDEFVSENDTLQIIYNFAGEDGLLTARVFNKSDEPYYVDWKRSSVVIFDESHSYYSGISNIYADESGLGSIQGEIIGEVNLTIVPPQSYVTSPDFYLNGFIPKELTGEIKHQIKMKSYSGYTKVDQYIFDELNSPLELRSFITVFDKTNYPVTFESVFWISEIIESLNGKFYFLDSDNQYRLASEYKPGNCSHITSWSEVGTTAGLTALAGILIVIPAVLIGNAAPAAMP